jgi:predicted tellurium resistance membrane protein TerC
MLELLVDPHAWAALITLTALEVVLGIDNIIFISVLVSRCDARRATRARQMGLSLAFVFRVILLFGLTWVMQLTAPALTVFDFTFSWRDIILIGGGLFLLAKGTHEIHEEVEHPGQQSSGRAGRASFFWIVVQLIVIDVVFSIDSIITAIGLSDHLIVMIVAIVIAMWVMYAASGPVTEFIKHYPTTKMLAFAFLLLIGVALVADGLAFHIPRGYIYFAMAFAALVEVLNVLARRRRAGRR